jgi:cytochrome c-type biogenesis protein CcmH
MVSRLLLALVVAAALVSVPTVVLAASGTAAEPAPAAHRPSDAEVAAVASQLRCVVCQSLSVADSPSEMAAQMRGIVRDRLAAGDSPDQVVQYFVDKYGEWILLAPRARGFTLLVWLVPALAVVLGLAVLALRLHGWAPRRRHVAHRPDPAMRERIRKELEAEP